MWTAGSHLDGTYLGLGSDADINTASAAPPSISPEGSRVPTVVGSPLLLGLTRQQWLTIFAIAAVTYLIVRRRREGMR